MPDVLMLRSYQRNISIRSAMVDIECFSCHIHDFGNTRSELKKWLPYYQYDDGLIDAILFVVSLTGYCQALPDNRNAVSNGVHALA